MYLEIYKILRLVIIIFTSSYFLGILWHIYVCDVEYAYMTKNEDGSYAPMTGLSLLSGTLFLGPLAVGAIYGFNNMGPVSLFPPFAIYAFLELIFGQLT